MTVVFLLYALLVAWLAYNLYRPLRKPGGASVVSFLAGWLVGELAWHHIVVQAAIAFAFIWGGAVEGFTGALAMMLLVAAWIAMGQFYASGHRAKPAMEQALEAGLGPTYREAIDEDQRARFAEEPDRARLIKPFARIDPTIEVIKDVEFGHHRQKLDIYRSRDPGDRQPGASRPVLMQIHGGAWTEKMGSKNEQALPLMAHMARRGWIAVSVDYRLSPRATWPEHLIDCKEGLKWIKDNIADYGGDPAFVIVTGGSAGGQLAAMMALTAGDPEYQPGFEDFDATVQGAVPFYGLMDFNAHFARYKKTNMDFAEATIFKQKREDAPEVFKRASPVHRVHAKAPPFFVIHGNQDSLVPVDQAREFVHQLRSISTAPVVYAEIDGAQHAFDMFPSVRSEHVKHGVERFLAWVESNHRQAD